MIKDFQIFDTALNSKNENILRDTTFEVKDATGQRTLFERRSSTDHDVSPHAPTTTPSYTPQQVNLILHMRSHLQQTHRHELLFKATGPILVEQVQIERREMDMMTAEDQRAKYIEKRYSQYYQRKNGALIHEEIWKKHTAETTTISR